MVPLRLEYNNPRDSRTDSIRPLRTVNSFFSVGLLALLFLPRPSLAQTIVGKTPDSVLQERLDDVIDAEHPQVGIGLAGSDKVDRLAGHVGHRERGTDLCERCAGGSRRQSGHSLHQEKEQQGRVVTTKRWNAPCRRSYQTWSRSSHRRPFLLPCP